MDNDREDYKVIVAGDRRFLDYTLLSDKLDRILSNKLRTHNVIIISGGASGADYLGERYAYNNGLELEVFPAQWKKYGNSAGPRRNIEMLEVADALVAFPSATSIGTRHMIKIAREKGIVVRVINVAV